MGSLIIPVVYELNACGVHKQTVRGDVTTKPSPFTSHTLQLDCSMALPPLAYARWRVCWTAQRGTGWIRLYAAAGDSGGQLQELARIDSTNMRNPGASNVSNDCTDLMYQHGVSPTDSGVTSVTLPALLKQGRFQNIGWDFAGDNANPLTFFTSRLEIGWKIEIYEASDATNGSDGG